MRLCTSREISSQKSKIKEKWRFFFRKKFGPAKLKTKKIIVSSGKKLPREESTGRMTVCAGCFEISLFSDSHAAREHTARVCETFSRLFADSNLTINSTRVWALSCSPRLFKNLVKVGVGLITVLFVIHSSHSFFKTGHIFDKQGPSRIHFEEALPHYTEIE